MHHLDFPRPTGAEINLDHLRYNLRSIRGFLGPEIEVMPVIKANAYGHGAEPCAIVLADEGINWFAVALLEEAIELRNAGVLQRILCFGGVWPGQAEIIVSERITPAIFDLEAAQALNNAAADAGVVADVHVKIDTGMGRVGVMNGDASGFAEKLRELRHIRVEGLLTHFAAADDLSESNFTNSQIDKFHQAVEAFRTHGHEPSILDMANSPGAVAHPRSRESLVRIGGILFGLGGDVLPAGVPAPQLKPVMSFKTSIALIKRVPAGSSIGYGRDFITERDSIIGTLPVGYHDGYRRALSDRGRVIVNGTFAPVVGRVSMDWITVDLTEVPNVKIGDAVALIGSEDGLAITAEDIAEQIDTISYEVTCGISARVRRIFVGRSNGEIGLGRLSL